MIIHLMWHGPPPPGASFASLCGAAKPGEQLTRVVGYVTCAACMSLIKKNG